MPTSHIFMLKLSVMQAADQPKTLQKQVTDKLSLFYMRAHDVLHRFVILLFPFYQYYTDLWVLGWYP